MRLSEQQIKDAILHEDQIVRSAALGYFSDSRTRDASVTARAIEAVEAYGWDHLVPNYYGTLINPVTGESAEWIIARLQEGPQGRSPGSRWRNFCAALVRSLVWADVDVLRPLQEDIRTLKMLDESTRQTLQTRLEWADATPQACWQELESLAGAIVAAEGKRFPYDDVSRAEAIASVVGPRAGELASRVLDLLASQFDPADDDPHMWLQGMSIPLAGWMRLAEAAPLLVQRVYDDWDWSSERIVESLKRINGTPALEAVASVFETAPWHVRLFCSGVLEGVRTEAAVQRLVEMADVERERFEEGEDSSLILSHLCTALARQFDTAALPPACDLYSEFAHDFEVQVTLREIVAAFLMLGEPSPELEQWKAEVDHQLEDERRWFREKTPPPAPRSPILSTSSLLGPSAAAAEHAPLGGGHDPLSPAKPITRSGTRPGRNDPCPCGSGKKYKKCCMRKGGPHIDFET